MISVRSMVLCVALGFAANACRSTSYADSRLEAQPRGGPALGAYQYTASLPDGTQLEGALAILPDTVILESKQVLCKAVAYTPRASRWVCNGVGRFGDVSFEIDRFSPGQQSRWRLTETVRRQRRECVEYVRLPTGQLTNRCARWEIKEYDAPQARSGVIRIVPRTGRDTGAMGYS
ncbi:MAG TPA: hypothetical protein VF178_13540 [Gemmatimonadaceae bacterium]